MYNIIRNNFFWYFLMALTYLIWIIRLETVHNEWDTLESSIQGNKTIFQPDLNREKIYYQAQFILAPEIYECTLPEDTISIIRLKNIKSGQMIYLQLKGD